MAAAKKLNKKQAQADSAAGHEPSVRTFTTWTPTLILAAEVAADSGNIRQAASLCDWLLGDDRVKGTLSSRVQALLGLNPTFEANASGGKRKSTKAIKALEAEEDWWVGYPETFLAQLHTWGLLLGVSPGRQPWIEFPDHGNRLLAVPEFWHPQHLRYDWFERVWKVRIARIGGFDTGTEETLTPGDGTWILHTPYGTNRPWSMGLWRGLARWVLLKWYALQDWARHSEKAAILAATTDPSSPAAENQTREERKQLAQDIYDRGREAVVALPPGIDLKLVETTANTKQIYEAQIAMANEAIAVAIRGGNLTTVVEEGSRAAIEGQERRGDQANLIFDAQSLPDTIHDQSLTYWAEFNFGDATVAPWPVYPVQAKKDVKKTAETANSAADAAQKFTNLGFEIDRKAFADEFGLADWLKPGTPIAPQPMPAPGQPQQPQQPGQPNPPEEPDDPEGDDNDDDDDEPTDNRAGNGRVSLQPGQRAQVQPRAQGNGQGWIEGQLYQDALVERASDLAQVTLKPDLTRIAEAIEKATDYQDLRERLRALYGELDPEALSEIVHRALLIAECSGRTAVNQDS